MGLVFLKKSLELELCWTIRRCNVSVENRTGVWEYISYWCCLELEVGSVPLALFSPEETTTTFLKLCHFDFRGIHSTLILFIH